MQSKATTVAAYLAELPTDRKAAMTKLRSTIKGNLPPGFAEVMQYGMISYVVPLKKYPAGYHTTANTPLPFISIASQKNFIALYHMGLYGDAKLLAWFTKPMPLPMLANSIWAKAAFALANLTRFQCPCSPSSPAKSASTTGSRNTKRIGNSRRRYKAPLCEKNFALGKRALQFSLPRSCDTKAQ